MYNLSKKVLDTLLEYDPNISSDQKEAVVGILEGKIEPRDWVCERVAADTLSIDIPCLNRWRNTKKNKSGERFNFSIYNTPANGIRYDRVELLKYVEDNTKKTEAI